MATRTTPGKTPVGAIHTAWRIHRRTTNNINTYASPARASRAYRLAGTSPKRSVIRQAALMASDRSEDRLRTWEHATAYPLTVLSLLFIGVYAWPILDTHLAPHWRHLCEIADLTIWALFCGEYAIRLSLARRRRRFVRTHWFDLAVLLLPVLRPLRALRLLNALRVINRHAVSWTRGRMAIYVVTTTVLIVLVASLAVLEAERGHPASRLSRPTTAATATAPVMRPSAARAGRPT